MEPTNQLQLYSINAAARVLHLGKDTVYKLVADGKIGYITIGKRKKIPYQELVRFQSENVTRAQVKNDGKLMSKQELNRFFNLDRNRKQSLNGNEILNSIMR
ncbi:MAG: helix-turn-helix domain-containing protein [Ignavibacteriales bacterium]|nr:helix-turn-helix domain-containing protein [Ignavibacteriales bacterium]